MADARQRYLGSELRRLREARGINGDAAALRMGWSPSKVCRYELARCNQIPAEVARLLDLYEVPEPRRGEIEGLARQLWRRGAAEYQDPLSPEIDEAAELSDWALLTFPRALQTVAYAQESLSAARPVLQTLRSQIATSVQAALSWQGRLASTAGKPLALRALLDESVLYRQVGSPELMRGQLEHVAELAGRDGATVRMLPYSQGGRACTTSFTYVRYAPVESYPVPDTVILQHLHATTLAEAEGDVDHYGMAFERMWDAALSEEDTAEAVRLACKATWA